jgi:hypothetical protein
LIGIARHADLLLWLAVEGLKLAIGYRPVDTAAVGAAQAKIVGDEAEAGAEPVPGGAADDLEIGALEFVGPGLPVPIVGIVADRMLGLGARRMGTQAL